MGRSVLTMRTLRANLRAHSFFISHFISLGVFEAPLWDCAAFEASFDTFSELFQFAILIQCTTNFFEVVAHSAVGVSWRFTDDAFYMLRMR